MSRPPSKARDRLLARFRADRRGATAIEYAMIASGIAMAIVATILIFGESVNELFARVASVIP